MNRPSFLKISVFALSLILAVGLSGCGDDDNKTKARKKGDGDKVTNPKKPVVDPDKAGKLSNSKNGSLVSGNGEDIGLGAGILDNDDLDDDTRDDDEERNSSFDQDELDIVLSDRNPRASGAIFQGNYGAISNPYSFTQNSNTDYHLRVVEPDGQYVHCDPQDRNNPEKCDVHWEPYTTGGTDQDLETQEKYFDFTDFSDDLVMFRLRKLAESWRGQLGSQDFIKEGDEFSNAFKYLYVTTNSDSNKVEVRATIEDKNKALHRILFTGNINNKKATLVQVDRPALDKGYSYQAYLTCLDQMPGSCETAVVVIEQINSNKIICNRAIGVSRVMDAQLRIPGPLMREVNCGLYTGGPSAKRFLSYIANTVHNRNIEQGRAMEAHCTFLGSQKKVPYMSYIQARSFAFAYGYAFIQVEGIESDYDNKDPMTFPEESRYIFDGNNLDWFRLSGDLKRSVDVDESKGEKPNIHDLLVEGSTMKHGDQAPHGDIPRTGMQSSASAIKAANMVGNDGRGWISIDVTFNDRLSDGSFLIEEIEFLGLGAKIFSPEGMKFYPYQGVEAQPVSTYPTPRN